MSFGEQNDCKKSMLVLCRTDVRHLYIDLDSSSLRSVGMTLAETSHINCYIIFIFLAKNDAEYLFFL